MPRILGVIYTFIAGVVGVHYASFLRGSPLHTNQSVVCLQLSHAARDTEDQAIHLLDLSWSNY